MLPVHNDTHAKKCKIQIKATTPNKRRSFAFGKFGKFFVLTVKGRKPAEASQALRKMKFEPATEPSEAKNKPCEILAFGLMYLNDDELVLQCGSKKQTTQFNLGVKHYLAYFHASGLLWQSVRMDELDEQDEGDPEDETDDVAETVAGEQDSDPSIEATGEDVLQPNDASGASESPPPDSSEGRPDDADPESSHDDKVETPVDGEDLVAGVTTLTTQAMQIAGLSGPADDTRKADWERAFANLLPKIPYEQLLLAMCHAPEPDRLMAEGDQIPTEPLEFDQDGKGIERTADALAAMIIRIANRNGLVISPSETLNKDILYKNIEAQSARFPAQPQEIIQRLIGIYSVSAAAMPHGKLRKMLGLSAEMPSSVPPEASDAAQAGDGAQVGPSDSGRPAELDALVDSVSQSWLTAYATVYDQINETKNRLTNALKPLTLKYYNASWAAADRILPSLDPERVIGQFDALLGSGDDAQLREKVSTVESTLADIRRTIEGNSMVTGLDKFPLGVTSSIQATVSQAVSQIIGELRQLAH